MYTEVCQVYKITFHFTPDVDICNQIVILLKVFCVIHEFSMSFYVKFHYIITDLLNFVQCMGDLCSSICHLCMYALYMSCMISGVIFLQFEGHLSTCIDMHIINIEQCVLIGEMSTIHYNPTLEFRYP